MTKAKESKNVNLYHNLRGYQDTYKRFPITHKEIEKKSNPKTEEKKTENETK